MTSNERDVKRETGNVKDETKKLVEAEKHQK